MHSARKHSTFKQKCIQHDTSKRSKVKYAIISNMKPAVAVEIMRHNKMPVVNLLLTLLFSKMVAGPINLNAKLIWSKLQWYNQVRGFANI